MVKDDIISSCMEKLKSECEILWVKIEQRCADGWLILLYKMVNGHVVVDYSSYIIPVTRHSRHIYSASYLLPYEQKKYMYATIFPS